MNRKIFQFHEKFQLYFTFLQNISNYRIYFPIISLDELAKRGQQLEFQKDIQKQHVRAHQSPARSISPELERQSSIKKSEPTFRSNQPAFQRSLAMKPAGSLLARLGAKEEKKSLMQNMRYGVQNIFGHFKQEDVKIHDKINEILSLPSNPPQLNHQSSLENMVSLNRTLSLTTQQMIQPKKINHAMYLENLKKLKDRITGDYFRFICLEGGTSLQFTRESPTKDPQYRNARLTKAKFRSFLSQRYGPVVAEKFALILDFTTPIDFTSFLNQIEGFLRSRELLRQVAFDVYDINNDNHISEGDLFRLFKMYDGSIDSGNPHLHETFEKAFQKDLLAMIKFVEAKKQAKQQVEKKPKYGALSSTRQNFMMY